MYPAHILSLFPPHARKDFVFVAMSFDPAFETLWTEVLSRAIAGVECNGKALQPHRVDLSRQGDSIITEIVQHIAEDRLILVDISTLGWMRKGRKRSKPIRNANVMYELGLAHASRVPEEVVIVRSDNDPLDFDVSGVRVHRYPEDLTQATRFIGHLLVDALHAVDQRRSIAVRHALRSLTPQKFFLLHGTGPLRYPDPKTFGDHIASQETRGAIKELLSDGLLEAALEALPANFMDLPAAELFCFRVTTFGRAVYQAARTELKFNEILLPWLETSDGRAWLQAETQRSAPT
jgi:hypothetical protein